MIRKNLITVVGRNPLKVLIKAATVIIFYVTITYFKVTGKSDKSDFWLASFV
jgi:hypothetical protein